MIAAPGHAVAPFSDLESGVSAISYAGSGRLAAKLRGPGFLQWA